jgi:DNA processing protein
MDIRSIILHLSLIEGIGSVTIDRLVSTLSYKNLIRLYECAAPDLVVMSGISMRQATAIVAGLRNRELLDQELELIAKHEIQWVVFCDQQYPVILKSIHMPPAVLYWRGKLPVDYSRAIAIVGSRKANYYGKKVINDLVADLVINNYITVSGGALGADTMVHQATVDQNGITIAVLGSGLLRPYPHNNYLLFDRIVSSGGCLISSFGLQVDALPGNFPARNRIIAGLSVGCVVVQAAQKSGAKITAHFALEQGKEVFAVPGHIDDPLSIGCHELIQEGATLLQSASDIFAVLLHTKELNIDSESMTVSGQIECDDRNISTGECATEPTARQIILAVCQEKPQSVDELLEETSLSLSELNSILFSMQLEGVIYQSPIGLWAIH